MLQPTKQRLRLYVGTVVAPAGQIRLEVKNPKTMQRYHCEFIVVRGAAVSLIGAKTSLSMGLLYQLLKEAGPGIVGPQALTTLFNRSISLGQVPDEWKHAIVFPIYKGGRKERCSPTNYRPISLTSCVARTMEKLLHCQVLEYLQIGRRMGSCMNTKRDSYPTTRR